MGMASSQARLLTLTARLHDVELKAQSVMSEKIALSVRKDEIYQNYCDALDATCFKVANINNDGYTSYVDANYASLCNYNENRLKQYSLKNNETGLVITSEEAVTNYKHYGNDKFAFAYAMLGFRENYSWVSPAQGCEVGIGTAQDDYGLYSEKGTGYSLYMTDCEQIVYNKHTNDAVLVDKYDEILKAETDSEQKEKLDNFREYLYSKYANEIYEQMNIDKTSENSKDITDKRDWSDLANEFNYYVNLWVAIKEAGGCEPVNKRYESGEDGNNWLQNMVEAGLVTIQVWDEKDSIDKCWSATSFATSTNRNHLQEMQDDKDLKKAEAEYEHELSIINKKDAEFDKDLSKLETERTSITTEIEGIEKVQGENVERTFGIFS